MPLLSAFIIRMRYRCVPKCGRHTLLRGVCWVLIRIYVGTSSNCTALRHASSPPSILRAECARTHESAHSIQPHIIVSQTHTYKHNKHVHARTQTPYSCNDAALQRSNGEPDVDDDGSVYILFLTCRFYFIQSSQQQQQHIPLSPTNTFTHNRRVP